MHANILKICLPLPSLNVGMAGGNRAPSPLPGRNLSADFWDPGAAAFKQGNNQNTPLQSMIWSNTQHTRYKMRISPRHFFLTWAGMFLPYQATSQVDRWQAGDIAKSPLCSRKKHLIFRPLRMIRPLLFLVLYNTGQDVPSMLFVCTLHRSHLTELLARSWTW